MKSKRNRPHLWQVRYIPTRPQRGPDYVKGMNPWVFASIVVLSFLVPAIVCLAVV